MKVLLTGATGFLGKRVTGRLEQAGHRVLPVSRAPGRGFDWSEESLRKGVGACDAVCHLAGESIAARWTGRRKGEVLRSRVETTDRLARLLAEKGSGALVSASAVGFYGDRGDEELDETSGAGTGFLAEVCRAWEDATRPARDAGLRVAAVRIGVILGAEGGALKRMLPVFRLGLGGRLGSGDQWFPWVHADDLACLFVHLLESRSATGVYNGTSPNPVKNREFTATLARVLGRPAFLPAPAFALRLVLGEMAEMLLGGQRALPRRAPEARFTFNHPDLEPALHDLLS